MIPERLIPSNASLAWLIAVSLATAVFALLLIARRVIVSRLSALSLRTSAQWDDIAVDVVRRTNTLFLLVVSVLAGASALSLPERASRALGIVAGLTILLQIGLWLTASARGLIERYRARRLEDDRNAATMFVAVGFLIQAVIWSAVLLVALSNLGVNITAFVASLGVGGVAIALATQNILGDLFSSLAIVLDKPFVIGDFIVVGDLKGTVEKVGLKTTRLKSLSGEQLIFSNADLLSSRVRNFGRMQERRILFRIGVTYQTPRSTLEQIPVMLRAAVESQSSVRFDRAHFASYGDFSLDFEVVYFVLSAEFNRYMDIQQQVNLSIHEQFEAADIEFAYPTQTLVMTRPTAALRPLLPTDAG